MTSEDSLSLSDLFVEDDKGDVSTFKWGSRSFIQVLMDFVFNERSNEYLSFIKLGEDLQSISVQNYFEKLSSGSEDLIKKVSSDLEDKLYFVKELYDQEDLIEKEFLSNLDSNSLIYSRYARDKEINLLRKTINKLYELADVSFK